MFFAVPFGVDGFFIFVAVIPVIKETVFAPLERCLPPIELGVLGPDNSFGEQGLLEDIPFLSSYNFNCYYYYVNRDRFDI